MNDVWIKLMVSYMFEVHGVEVKEGFKLAKKYINDIDIDSSMANHLGYDYFAIQILMAEGIIPYKPI